MLIVGMRYSNGLLPSCAINADRTRATPTPDLARRAFRLQAPVIQLSYRLDRRFSRAVLRFWGGGRIVVQLALDRM